MRLLIVVLIMASTFIGSLPVNALPIQWPGNNHYYQLFTSPLPTWHDAKNAAESLLFAGTPGHLLTLTSAAEEDFIRLNFGSQSLWLGLTDEVNDGVFEWVTGEPFTYSNWQTGEPNGGTFENYGEIVFFGGGATSGWNDLPANHARGYIVEWKISPVPEPGTIVLLGAGLLGLGVIARRRSRTKSGSRSD